MLSELFIAKFTNNFAALHILIQPLVYQVQCIFCIWLKHISLIQSTIESLIQKFSFPKILTILRNLWSIVISKISRHLQNTPLKKGLKFLERTFLQPIYFFFTLSIYLYLQTTCPEIFKSLFHIKWKNLVQHQKWL